LWLNSKSMKVFHWPLKLTIIKVAYQPQSKKIRMCHVLSWTRVRSMATSSSACKNYLSSSLATRGVRTPPPTKACISNTACPDPYFIKQVKKSLSKWMCSHVWFLEAQHPQLAFNATQPSNPYFIKQLKKSLSKWTCSHVWLLEAQHPQLAFNATQPSTWKLLTKAPLFLIQTRFLENSGASRAERATSYSYILLS